MPERSSQSRQLPLRLPTSGTTGPEKQGMEQPSSTGLPPSACGAEMRRPAIRVPGQMGRIDHPVLTRSETAYLEAIHSKGKMVAGKLSIPATCFPSQAAVDRLERRGHEIAAAITPGKLGETFTDAVTALIAVKATYGADNVKLAIRGAAYRMILTGQPEWAVVQAVKDAIASPLPAAEDPGQILARVNRITAPLQRELHMINAVLTAEVETEPSPEERERVTGLIKGLAASMRGGTCTGDLDSHLPGQKQGRDGDGGHLATCAAPDM